jgi:hypothetical protein
MRSLISALVVALGAVAGQLTLDLNRIGKGAHVMKSRLVMTFVIMLAIAGAVTSADTVLRTYQTKNVFQFGNPANLMPGGATLYRAKQAVEMRVATGGLMANSSYTVWWVIFNNPAACTVPCGMDDLGNPNVMASVLYAAGFVTGTGNTGNVTAHLETGPPASGVDVELGNGLEPGNGLGAEIHLVVRTHGTTTPGIVDLQIGSFNGGCTPTCANVQAAMFPPVN